jgi:hypothetical protein
MDGLERPWSVQSIKKDPVGIPGLFSPYSPGELGYNAVRGDYMPIIVSRKTGQIVSVPEYSQEQKNRAWEIIVRQNAEKILAGLRPDPEPGRESPVRNVTKQDGNVTV